MPLLLYILLSNQGSFPPQALPPHPQYYEPIRHPASPDCSSRISSWCIHTTDRASRVATSLIFHACQCHYPGGNTSVRVSLSSQCVSGFPLITAGSASASILFRGLLDILCATAHKTFTRVPARMFAGSPEATLLTKVLQTISLPP